MASGENAEQVGQYILITDSETARCYATDLGQMCKAYDSLREADARFVMLLRLHDWCARLPADVLANLTEQVTAVQQLTRDWGTQTRRLQGIVKYSMPPQSPASPPSAQGQETAAGRSTPTVYYVALTWMTSLPPSQDLFKHYLPSAEAAVTFARELSKQLAGLCTRAVYVRPVIAIEKLALEPGKEGRANLVLGDLGLDNILDLPRRSDSDEKDDVGALVALLGQLLDGVAGYTQGALPDGAPLAALRPDVKAVRDAWPWVLPPGAAQEDLWHVLLDTSIRQFSVLAERLENCSVPQLPAPPTSPTPPPPPGPPPGPPPDSGPIGQGVPSAFEQKERILVRIPDSGGEHVFEQPLVQDGIVLLGSQGFAYVSYPQQGQTRSRAEFREVRRTEEAARLAQRRIYVQHHDNRKTRTQYYTITDYDPPRGAPRLLLDGQPLSPLFAALIINRSVLELDSLRISLQSQLAGDPSGWIVPLMRALDPLERGRMPLELAVPGQRLVLEPYLANAALPLVVRNLTQRLDGLSIFVDTPLGWPAAQMRTVPLDGRQVTETQYLLPVPEQLPAGEYPLVVRLISDNIAAQVAAIGVRLVVPPLYTFGAVLEPQRIRNGHSGELHLHNSGNVGRQFLVSWRSHAKELNFEPAETIVALPPFSSGVVSYRAKLRPEARRYFGSEKQHDMSVQVEPESIVQGAPQVLSGHVVSRALPGCVPALALLLLLTMCAWYMVLHPPRFENHAVIAGGVAGTDPIEGQMIALQWQDSNACIYSVERNGEAIAAPQFIFPHWFSDGRRTVEFQDPLAGDQLTVNLRSCWLVGTDAWTVEVLAAPPPPPPPPLAPALDALAAFSLRTQNVVVNGFGTGGPANARSSENEQFLLAGQTGDLCIHWAVAETFSNERYGLRLVTEPRVEAIEQQAQLEGPSGEKCFPIATTFTNLITDTAVPNIYYIRLGTVERATGSLLNVSSETKVVQLLRPVCRVKTNEPVWMREGPGMEFAERGRMPPGDQIFPQGSPLRLRDLNQDDVWWTPVTVANDPRVGWIQATNLDCPLPIEVLPANDQIPATPTPTATPSPTATPLPTLTPTPVPEPSFSVDPQIIEQGECAMLKWSIQNVQAVFLDGVGVVGEGELRVCPPDEGTFVYTWLIVNKDGTQMQRSVTLDVNED